MHSSSSSLGKVRTIGNPSLLGKTTDRHDFAIYSLFAEFLASRQKSSALQALLREIGMSEDMLYSPEQIGQALSLMRNQIFSKCLERLGNGPLVERIFRELVHRTPRMCSNSTQTDDSDSPRTNISRESSGLRLESSALKILSGRKSASNLCVTCERNERSLQSELPLMRRVFILGILGLGGASRRKWIVWRCCGRLSTTLSKSLWRK